MITVIVLPDGEEIKLGHDGVFNILEGNIGQPNQYFQVHYVGGDIRTLLAVDQYTSVTP